MALDKLMAFDVALVFETYIRSMVSEIEASRDKSELYALVLEEKVVERTRQLEELSRTDPLTGLLNRRHLDETLFRILRGAQRRHELVTLAYLDVDNFKLINDKDGHQRGDEVLSQIGKLIQRLSRAEDGCFRLGGDEFCLVLPNCNREQAEEVYLERLRLEMDKELPGATMSMGCVETGPIQFVSPAQLLAQADSKMYQIKEQHLKSGNGASKP